MPKAADCLDATSMGETGTRPSQIFRVYQVLRTTVGTKAGELYQGDVDRAGRFMGKRHKEEEQKPSIRHNATTKQKMGQIEGPGRVSAAVALPLTRARKTQDWVPTFQPG